MRHDPDDISIEKNHTHCNTEDLEALITAAGKAVAGKRICYTWSKKQFAAVRMQFTQPRYRPLLSLSVKYDRKDAEHSWPSMGKTCITFPHPESGCLDALGQLQWGMGQMPDSLLTSLWRMACYRWMDGRSWPEATPRSDFENGCPPLPSDVSVRIAAKTYAPKGRKSTPESRIKRAWEYYGDGSVLGSQAGRYVDYGWREPMLKARQQYEKELERVEKWAKRLRKEGVEPPAYPTFAEYLRKCADEIDGGV